MVQVQIPVGRLREEDGTSTDPCWTLEVTAANEEFHLLDHVVCTAV